MSSTPKNPRRLPLVAQLTPEQLIQRRAYHREWMRRDRAERRAQSAQSALQYEARKNYPAIEAMLRRVHRRDCDWAAHYVPKD